MSERKFMVRFFSDGEIKFECFTRTWEEARDYITRIGAFCVENKFDFAVAIMYDYVPFGWRPVAYTKYDNGRVSKCLIFGREEKDDNEG